MNCNDLGQTGDHFAWQQRVNKELGNSRRFGEKGYGTAHSHSINQNTGHSKNNFWMQDGRGVDPSTVSGIPLKPKVVYSPYTRVNQTYDNMKKMQGYMSDGTAINMGDPSSMRDQGQTRNAIYNVNITDRLRSSQSSNRSKPYSEFLNRDAAANNCYYSFGGKHSVHAVVSGKGVYNPLLSAARFSQPASNSIVYRKDPLERVNDYTKNISQSIFSPGDLPATNPKKLIGRITNEFTPSKLATRNNSVAALPRRGGARNLLTKHKRAASAFNGENARVYHSTPQVHRRVSNASQPATLSHQKLSHFATMLKEESERKQKLRKEIDEIRSNMTQFRQITDRIDKAGR